MRRSRRPRRTLRWRAARSPRARARARSPSPSISSRRARRRSPREPSPHPLTSSRRATCWWARAPRRSGISSLASGAGLAVGAHTISVTQASAGCRGVVVAAACRPRRPLPSSNDELDVTVNGTTQSVDTREWHLLELPTGERDQPVLGRHARRDRQRRRRLDGRDESARLERVAASDGRIGALGARPLEWVDRLWRRRRDRR